MGLLLEVLTALALIVGSVVLAGIIVFWVMPWLLRGQEADFWRSQYLRLRRRMGDTDEEDDDDDTDSG